MTENRSLPYAAFTKHLTPTTPAVLPANEPKPIDPVQRITESTLAKIKIIQEVLAQAQVDVMAHFPDTVRLKLSKMLLATSEKTEIVQTALVQFQQHGTLKPTNGGKPRSRRKPS